MIELIFAIVIMGVAFTAAPLLITQVKKVSIFSIKQEGINLVATHVNLIMSHNWDDKNTRALSLNNVLNTVSGADSLKFNALTGYRGERTGFKNTRLFSLTKVFKPSTKMEVEYDKNTTNFIDDIDDFHGSAGGLILTEEASTKDYVDKTVSINTTIGYRIYKGDFNLKNIVVENNGTSATSTDFKYISSTLTSKDDNLKDVKLVLDAFSSNIGSYSLNVEGGF